MSIRYIVAKGQEFVYPADPASWKLIQDAGGWSKLSVEANALMKHKIVKEGGDCSDMDASSLAIYVARGWIIDTFASVPTLIPEIELPTESLVEEEGV